MTSDNRLRGAFEEDPTPALPANGMPTAGDIFGRGAPVPPRRDNKAVQELQARVEQLDSLLDTSLVPQEDGTLYYRGIVLTRTGLVIPEDIGREDFQVVGDAILHWDDAVQWWLGDLLGFGERKWGVTYQQVAEQSGREEKTLRNYVWVATHVDLSLRKDKLTFGHHNLVAGMTPNLQAHWLDRAETEGLTVSALRKAIKGDGGEKPAPMIPAEVKEDFTYLASLSGIPFDRTAREEIRERIVSARAWLDELERRLR